MANIFDALKKKPVAPASPTAKAAGDFPNSDFIPYAVFYNDRTILTKNGELLQTIRIPLNSQGLPSENAETTGMYLRDAVRHATMAHLNDHHFSHWLHVFRDREPIAPLSTPANPFAKELQESWLGTQRTGYSYHNCCYLTIVVQGQSADLFDMDDFKKGGRKNKNRKHRQAFLEQQAQLLEATTHSVMQDIAKHFNVHRLGMVERSDDDGQTRYYSEHMEWLNRLISMREEPIVVDEVDLSEQLDHTDLIFGFDAFEARKGKQKRFASVVSLKHYHELPPELFDRFMQLPIEMVVTQASHPIDTKQALEPVKALRDTLTHSEDGFIAEASGFMDSVRAGQPDGCGFATQQTTIMIMTDHYAELDQLTVDLQTAIAKIGLLSVREDIKLEEVFWSQLPSNFEFLRRAHPMPTNKLDGLARLNYYPTGKATSRWGEAITVLPTATQTPYLLHFHQEQSGHTAIYDFNSFPDAVGYRLTHFLAASASKQVGRVIMFDRHGVGEMLVGSMGGHYMRLGGKQQNLSLNPLGMPCIPANQGFLAAWLAMLLEIGAEDTDGRDAIRSCVAQGWDEARASEGFGALAQMMQSINTDLGGRLRAMMSRPAFGACFAGGMDNFDISQGFSGINLHVDVFHEGSAPAIFALMLHRVIMSLDDQPTLIVLKDAWDVLDHPFFISRLKSLMDMLTERNAAMLMTNRDPEKMIASHITPIITEQVATKLIVPDDIPCDYMTDTLNYDPAYAEMLKKMERQKGAFLVLHGDEVIATKMELHDSTQHAILSGDTKTLQAIRNA